MAKGVWVGIAVGAIALTAGLAYLWTDALVSLKYARQGEDEGFEQIGLMKSLLPIANQAASDGNPVVLSTADGPFASV